MRTFCYILIRSFCRRFRKAQNTVGVQYTVHPVHYVLTLYAHAHCRSEVNLSDEMRRAAGGGRVEAFGSSGLFMCLINEISVQPLSPERAHNKSN